MNRIKKYILLLSILFINCLYCASAETELNKAIAESKKSYSQSLEQKEKAQLAQAMQESLGLNPEEALSATLAQSLLEERGKTTFTLTGEPILQYSYKSDTANLETQLIKNQLTYFAYIPLIGKYADPYVMLNPIAIIENKVSQLANIAPDILLKEMGPILGSANAEKNIKFYTLVWGLPVGDIGDDKTYNLIHHPAAVAWFKKTAGFNESNFINKLTMGIFNPDGISAAKENAAAINSLRPEDVSIHPSADGIPAFSPNNVRFTIEPNREVATFWSIAQSPDKKEAVVAFNIIVQNFEVQRNLFKNKKALITPEKFWPKLISFAMHEKLNDQDKKALERAVARLM